MAKKPYVESNGFAGKVTSWFHSCLEPGSWLEQPVPPKSIFLQESPQQLKVEKGGLGNMKKKGWAPLGVFPKPQPPWRSSRSHRLGKEIVRQPRKWTACPQEPPALLPALLPSLLISTCWIARP